MYSLTCGPLAEVGVHLILKECYGRQAPLLRCLLSRCCIAMWYLYVVVLRLQSLYLSRTKNHHEHWVCWMSTSRKNGFMRRTHTAYDNKNLIPIHLLELSPSDTSLTSVTTIPRLEFPPTVSTIGPSRSVQIAVCLTRRLQTTPTPWAVGSKSPGRPFPGEVEAGGHGS